MQDAHRFENTFLFLRYSNFPYNLDLLTPEYDNLFPDKTGKEISVNVLFITDKVVSYFVFFL